VNIQSAYVNLINDMVLDLMKASVDLLSSSYAFYDEFPPAIQIPNFKILRDLIGFANL